MSLLYISQQLTLYVGIFLLITGIIGNGITILIFSNSRTYRKTPSSFYFLINSIVNALYLLVNLSTRIINGGFGINLNDYSIFWCKTRPYLVIILSMISFSCSCLAGIDQFLVTSQNVRFRRYSNIQWTYIIVCLVIIISCLHGIPISLYMNIPLTGKTCVYTNDIYQTYISIFVPVFLCIIPVIIVGIFGYLTYRNIRQTIVLAEQRADRQLTIMTLNQAAVIIISAAPYGIMYFYSFATNGSIKTMDQQLKEYLMSTIFSLISYFYYTGNFYIFFISSKRFRQTVKDRILCWRRSNQIYPSQT